ncbi:organic anion transporter 3-like [Bolinopsis microptera]|uniref:organic anion transporter 3-like n=1 Tax=Bolinopsis microptera TaxID=2820187 RepID=UPI003078F778
MPDKTHASVRRVSTNSMMKPRPSSALDKARKARMTALQTEELKLKDLITPERSKSSKNLFATEEILTKVIQRPTKKFSLFITGILYVSAMGGAQTLFHSLCGHLPYSEWDCLGNVTTNPKCFEATQSLNRSTNGSIYNKTTICANKLKAGLHFNWVVSDVNFFSTEWGLYCDEMGLYKDLIVQMFFIGSGCGTLLAWLLYDTIGRRTSAMIGLVISITVTAVSAFSPNAYLMIIYRFFQGFGMLIYYTAVYIYLMEIVPSSFRVIVSTFYMVFWSFGQLFELFIFVMCKNWGTTMSFMGMLMVISLIPLLYGPDSPRFKLVTLRRELEARKELELLFGLNGETFHFKEFKAALTFHEQRMDEITGINIVRLHPKFVKEMIVLIILWFVVGFSYYGFGYSFSQLSKNIVPSTLYAAIGEIFASLMTIVPLLYLGRKLSCQIFFFLAGASFVVMMFPFPGIKNAISVQELTALLGNMGVSAAFSSLYLYTFELSPTTHRGRIFNTCQFACRVGSFLGARSNKLYEVSKYMALMIFAVMNIVCFGLLFLMPKTKGRPTPDVPIEVERRSYKPKKGGEAEESRRQEKAVSKPRQLMAGPNRGLRAGPKRGMGDSDV